MTTEDVSAAVKSLRERIQDAVWRSDDLHPLPGGGEHAVVVYGDGAVVGNRNRVTQVFGRARVTVAPGPGCLTEPQVNELRDMVRRIARAGAVRHGRVWQALFNYLERTAGTVVSALRLIPAADFEHARSYLARWVDGAEGRRGSRS